MVGMAMVLVAAGVLVIFRSGAHESTVAEPGHQPFRPNSPHPVQAPERIGSVELAGKIAFASQAGGGLFHIHLINADGTGETTLTSGPGEDRDPAWSPDRTRIAFVRHAKPTDLLDVNTDIYVIAADGTGPSRLTDGPEAEGDPAWSPDGSRIAFFATDSSTGRRHIAVRRIDGAGQADLSDPPERCNDREPTWSPDAMRLVFVRKCGDEPSALYLTGADGQGLLLLTQFGRTPDWSPDGARIVYTGLGLHGPSVYVMKADGSGKTQLTDGRPSGDPEWSPDGTKIVFAGTDLATVHLFIMDADGSNVRRLTSKPAEDVTASW
jgi:Tol biopolymer transport system component